MDMWLDNIRFYLNFIPQLYQQSKLQFTNMSDYRTEDPTAKNTNENGKERNTILNAGLTGHSIDITLNEGTSVARDDSQTMLVPEFSQEPSFKPKNGGKIQPIGRSEAVTHNPDKSPVNLARDNSVDLLNNKRNLVPLASVTAKESLDSIEMLPFKKRSQAGKKFEQKLLQSMRSSTGAKSASQSMIKVLRTESKLRESINILGKSSLKTLKQKKAAENSDDEPEEYYDGTYDFMELAQTQDSQTLLEKMSFDIDMQKLYSVISTCNFNEANQFCPILLQVNDQKLQDHYKGQYLVQVWSNNKRMVFERIYKNPVQTWGLYGSLLIYREDLAKDELQKSSARKKNNAQPEDQVFMEDEFSEGESQQEMSFCIVDLSSAKGKVSMIRIKLQRDHQFMGEEMESIVGIQDNRMILASSRSISYIDLTEEMKFLRSPESPKVPATFRGRYREYQSLESVHTVSFDYSQLQKVSIDAHWIIKGMHEIVGQNGEPDVCLICEDTFQNLLVFYQIDEFFEQKMVLAPLVKSQDGPSQDLLNSEPDSVISYKSIISWNQRNEDYMQVGIALRNSGSVDFYFNFVLVEKANAVEGQFVYTAIDADYKSLRFKRLEHSPEHGSVLVEYECQTTWNQRVGQNSSTVVTTEKTSQLQKRLRSFFDQLSSTSMIIKRDKLQAGDFENLDTMILIDSNWFNAGLGQRITNYFKLFSSFINLGRRFIMAHNKFVSIFHLSKQEWTHHQQFDDRVRQIFRHRIINNPNIKIGVLIGMREFNFFKLDSLGKPMLTEERILTDGTITDFMVDQTNDTGFYFMEQNLPQMGVGTARDNNYRQKLSVSMSDFNFDSVQDAASDGHISIKVLVDSTISDITPISMKKQKYMCQMGIPQTGAELGKDTDTFMADILLDIQPQQESLRKNAAMRRLKKLTLSFDDDQVTIKREGKPYLVDPAVVKAKTDLVGGETRGEERFLGQVVKDDKVIFITNKHITIIDEESREVLHVMENRNIKNFIYVDSTWIYALKDASISYDNEKGMQYGASVRSGFYIYDVIALIEGRVEVHRMQPALGGALDFIDFDFDTQTIAFVRDFQSILLMPLAHRNTINFFGMGKKKDYLIWRQQDGIFTALDRKLKITMWSTVTGKILQQSSSGVEDDVEQKGFNQTDKVGKFMAEKIFGALQSKTQDAMAQKMDIKNTRQFSVYQANSRDQTYLRDWNNKGDFSYSLVFAPVSKIVKIDEKNEMEQELESRNPFIDGTKIQPPKGIPEQRYVFKIYKLTDSMSADRSISNVSTVSINFGKKGQNKNLTWKEQLNFEMDIPNENNAEMRPYIYFSHDLSRMLVKRPENFSATIYQHGGIKAGKQVKWSVKYKINRYPMMLQGKSSANFIFSPSFEKYFDINYAANQLVIRDTASNDIIAKIPDGLMSISFKGQNKSQSAISAISSRVQFHSETHLRIISKEGMDCIIDFRTLEIQSFAAIDNFDQNDFDHPHAILEQMAIEPHLIAERLMRKVNWIKQTRLHLEGKYRAKNAQLKAQKQPQLSKEEIDDAILKGTYQQMFSVDYTDTESFAIELSFTLLDMKILQRIVNDKTYDFSNVCEDQRLQMCFNVFPQVSSVFHTLAANANVCDYRVIQNIFDTAQQGLQRFQGKPVTIPIFRNQNNQTAIDECLDEEKYMNIKLASFLFKNITNYPIAHSSYLLSKATIKGIEYDIPGIIEFIEGRLINSPHLSVEKMENSALNKSLTGLVNSRSYAAAEFQIWESKNKVAKTLFDPKGFAKKLRLAFFDIPFINDMSVESDEFFEVLAATDNLPIFMKTSIQVIINKAWDEHFWFFSFFLLLPNVILILSYTTWSIIIDTGEFAISNIDNFDDSTHFYQLVLVVFIYSSVFYILILEAYQCQKDVRDYFTDIWNFLDLVPGFAAAAGPFINLFYLHSSDADKLDPEVVTNLVFIKTRTKMVASLLLWFKFLYFMRVNKQLSYLIKMFTEVLVSIIPFMIVFLIFIIAFSTANFALIQLQDTALVGSWAESTYYAYLQALGLTEVGDLKGNTFLQIVFTINTILNLIVMLNLLIAIIGDTYNVVSATQEEYAFKEKCNVIADCRDFPLFRWWVKPRSPSTFLFVALSEELEQNEKERVYLIDVYREIKKVQGDIAGLDQRLNALTNEVDQLNDVDKSSDESEIEYENDGTTTATLVRKTTRIESGLVSRFRRDSQDNEIDILEQVLPSIAENNRY